MIAEGFNRKNPYCAGIVALDEGPQMSGQILGVNAREPRQLRLDRRSPWKSLRGMK